MATFRETYADLIKDLRSKCVEARKAGDHDVASAFGDAAITLSYRIAHYDEQTKRFRSVRQAPTESEVEDDQKDL